LKEKQFTVLCVDDEPAVLRPLEIMLQRRGFNVLTASNGTAAIELFRSVETLDAVVLDYAMPDLSGGEVARMLRQENPTIPIILHTGYKDLDDPLLENVTCTLPKGSLNFLVTKLHDLLGRREASQPENANTAPAHVA
jgi:CheY-like chemotaxis protein